MSMFSKSSKLRISDLFDSFRWLDKLGMAAKNNVGVVLRQSFYGGKYALLDDKTLDPNPVGISRTEREFI